jgi:hypothetical protein
MAKGSSKKAKSQQGSKNTPGAAGTQSQKQAPQPAPATPENKGLLQKVLDGVEKVGNKVPHPVLMFFYLMIGVIVLSAVLSLLGVSVTEQIAVPAPMEVTPDFYEDVSEYTLSGVGAVMSSYVIHGTDHHHQQPAEHRGHSLPVHLLCAELSGLRRVGRHAHCHDGRRAQRRWPGCWRR